MTADNTHIHPRHRAIVLACLVSMALAAVVAVVCQYTTGINTVVTVIVGAATVGPAVVMAAADRRYRGRR